jgi:hypothetical protein
MMADICNCAGSASCGCRVPSQRMSNAQGNRTFPDTDHHFDGQNARID